MGRRGPVAVCWLGAAMIVLPHTAGLEGKLEVSAQVRDSEARAVTAMLAGRFGSPIAAAAALVVTGGPPPRSAEGVALLESAVAAMADVPGVTRCVSWLDGHDDLLLGARDAGAVVVIGLDPGGRRMDEIVPVLLAATGAWRSRLAARHPGATVRLTGEPVLNYEMRRYSTSEARAAERRALPLTLGLLVIAFGSVVAAALPVAMGTLGIALAIGMTAWLARFWPLSVYLVSITTMIGLGLGIDFSLLMVSRFREERRGGARPGPAGRTDERAAARALAAAGPTILLAGTAVAIGFAGLLTVPVNEIRSIAVGGMAVSLVSAALATTLVPGVLVWLGPRLDRWSWRRTAAPPAGALRWRGWARRVITRPVTVLLVAGVPLVWLAAQAGRARVELPGSDWLPTGMESAEGIRDLKAIGRAGLVQTVKVLLVLPSGTTVLDPAGWEAIRRVGRALAADPRVMRVLSLPNLLGGESSAPWMAGQVSAVARRTFLARDGSAALIEAVPREDAGVNDLLRLVREMRRRDAPALAGVAGARVLVGGLPAVNVDYEDALAGRLVRVVLLVVAGSCLVLMIGFRSFLIPLKAIALNLLAVAAAFGALVLVYQEGWLGAWLGPGVPTGAIFPALPVVVFCTVFGLGIDYEVFLVSRIAAARRGGAGEATAIARGLVSTAGVITSAAVIMVTVFAAFMAGGFLIVNMLGFALAASVLLDATLVRLAVGPALFRLAGKWNWWPGHPL